MNPRSITFPIATSFAAVTHVACPWVPAASADLDPIITYATGGDFAGLGSGQRSPYEVAVRFAASTALDGTVKPEEIYSVNAYTSPDNRGASGSRYAFDRRLPESVSQLGYFDRQPGFELEFFDSGISGRSVERFEIGLTNNLDGGHRRLLGVGEGYPRELVAFEEIIPFTPETAANERDTSRFWLTGQHPLREVLPDHIIVLEHGFQPRSQFVDDVRMPQVHASIQESLSTYLSRGDVLLLSPTWEEAFTSALDYPSAYIGSQREGGRLAASLEAQVQYGKGIDPDYNPSIHIIGHSLGTVSAAFAVNGLNQRGIHVDMVTLLDTPLQTSGALINTFPVPADTNKAKLASFDDAILFWRLMPTGSVDYVENFYSIRNGLGGSYGQPIAGAGPVVDGSLVGFEVPFDHGGVQSKFYADLVRGGDNLAIGFDVGDWVTPALTSNLELVWDPTGLEDAYFDDLLLRAKLKTRAEIRREKNLFFRNRDGVIFDFQKRLGEVVETASGVRLVARSPASITAELDLKDVLYLEFNYVGDDPSSELSVWLEDQLLWEADAVSSEIRSAFVMLTDYYGQQTIEWRYDSEITGSTLDLTGLELTRVVAVPEPVGLVGLLAGLGLAGLRRRGPFAKN